MSDESTTVLQGVLERAITGDIAARRRLLDRARDRLMRHARRLRRAWRPLRGHVPRTPRRSPGG